MTDTATVSYEPAIAAARKAYIQTVIAGQRDPLRAAIIAGIEAHLAGHECTPERDGR
jgi:hypothetical protein